MKGCCEELDKYGCIKEVNESIRCFFNVNIINVILCF